MKELIGYETNKECPDYKGCKSMDEITIVAQIPLLLVVRVGHKSLSTQSDSSCQGAVRRFLPALLQANTFKIGRDV
jgi:hypothetical protein